MMYALLSVVAFVVVMFAFAVHVAYQIGWYKGSASAFKYVKGLYDDRL